MEVEKEMEMEIDTEAETRPGTDVEIQENTWTITVKETETFRWTEKVMVNVLRCTMRHPTQVRLPQSYSMYRRDWRIFHYSLRI